MKRPLVSVIIPAHNRQGFLEEALDSVARQTLQDFEVIVVDDGSTEPVAPTIADHAARPTVIRQPRRGPAAARNSGVQHAAADILAFLDSDDLWDPTKLERFIRALDDHPDRHVFYGPMRPITADGKTVPGRTKPCHAGWITQKLFCSSFVHVPTVVCRKELLLDAGGFNQDLPVCEDYELWLRLSVEHPFGLVEEPLALRRLHADRLSKSCMSRNLAVKARVLRRFYESNAANGHLNRELCIARLARVFLAAARASFRGGQYRRASGFCRIARDYGGPSLRATPLALAARALGHFAHDDQGDPDLLQDTTETEQNELTCEARS
jgi:glycosyltransferase involved in cell wall biosynthesis